MASKKHDWNSLENYLSIHENVLDSYIKKYYVRGPTQYTQRKITDRNIELSLKNLILKSHKGTEIEFKIEKTILVDTSYARPRARTYDYSYHALLPRPIGANLIRYCSPHEHRPFHHKHIYNSDGDPEVVEVPEGTWPHVNEFLDEVLGNY